MRRGDTAIKIGLREIRILPCGQRQRSSQTTVVQPSSSGRQCLHPAPSLSLLRDARHSCGSRQGHSATLHIHATISMRRLCYDSYSAANLRNSTRVHWQWTNTLVAAPIANPVLCKRRLHTEQDIPMAEYTRSIQGVHTLITNCWHWCQNLFHDIPASSTGTLQH